MYAIGDLVTSASRLYSDAIQLSENCARTAWWCSLFLSLSLFVCVYYLMFVPIPRTSCHRLWQFSWDIVTDHGKLIILCWFFVLIFCWFYSVAYAVVTIVESHFDCVCTVHNAFCIMRLAAKSRSIVFIAFRQAASSLFFSLPFQLHAIFICFIWTYIIDAYSCLISLNSF